MSDRRKRLERIKAALCTEARDLAEVVRAAGELREEDAADRLGIEVDSRGVCVRYLVYLITLCCRPEGEELIEEVDVATDLDTDRWLLRWVGPGEPTRRPPSTRSTGQMELF